MGEENEKNSWSEWSIHVLKELERLNKNYENISTEIQKTNKEITRVSGMKFAINDLKTWKEGLDKIVNEEDLKAMKAAFQEVVTHKEGFDKLKLKLDKALEEVETLNRFKSNAKVLLTIILFIITTALTVAGLLLK